MFIDPGTTWKKNLREMQAACFSRRCYLWPFVSMKYFAPGAQALERLFQHLARLTWHEHLTPSPNR